MVAQLPLKFAAIDALYAVGLGLLIAVLYTCVRMLLPNKAFFAFIADLAVLILCALLYMSAVTTKFYGGVIRWYTLLALFLGYASWQLVAHKKFVWLAQTLKFLLLLPIKLICSFVIKPVIGCIGNKLSVMSTNRAKKRKNKRKSKTKQLQKPKQVLYNSN